MRQAVAVERDSGCHGSQRIVKKTYRRGLGGAAIDDIISHGTDPGRGPWPRRLLIGAIAAAVLAALIVQHLPGGSGHRSPQHRRHAAQAAGPAVLIRPARPDGIPGPTAPWAAGLRLLMGGSRPAWLYPATGRITRIGGLPPARSGYVFTRVGGGWAVQPSAGAGPWCTGCAARPLPVWFLADRARAARIVGLADRVAPAAEPGAVWLTSYLADTAGETGYAQEVSAAGKPLVPRLRLPAGYGIDVATDRGLLLTRTQGGAPGYELWNPSDRHVTKTFRSVIAASADKVAWTPRCTAQCLVRVLDLSTGKTTRIALLGGSAARGAFSPDGRLLALAVSIGNGGDGGATAMQLQVASLPGCVGFRGVAPPGRHCLTVVPGTWASSDALSGFGWPAGDDSLVAELSFMTKVQVASWRPGSSRLAVVVVRLRQHPNDLVVG